MRLNPIGGMQIRPFSTGISSRYPLQPLKQRKTTLNRNPRRPHLPDPIETDRSAQRFKLADHPHAMLVIREPSSMPNLNDDLFGSVMPPKSDSTLVDRPTDPHPSRALSHPVLTNANVTNYSSIEPPQSSHLYGLPPRLREPKLYPNSITPAQAKEIESLRSTHSLTQLSKKFGVPRLLISILTAASSFASPRHAHSSNLIGRDHVQVKHNMKSIRKQSRWSVAKSVRRYEKLIRRSMW